MKLQTLYSRRSDGQVQEWTVEVQGDKFRTISGISNGSLVESEWTVCQPKNTGKKNATTGAEQSLKEAGALHKKKLDKGYKVDVSSIDDVSFTEPMLAKEFRGGEIDWPVYVQPKLDGIRCISRKDGLWSRNGKQFVSCPHIEQSLRELHSQTGSIILDGEFYAEKFSTNFNSICELVKRSKPKPEDLERAKAIQYWVYDLPSHGGNFGARNNVLHSIVEKLQSPYIKYVPTQLVSTQEEMDALYGKWLDEGYEGQMVRLDAPYEFKRSKNLLKRKEFKDGEYRIVDIEEGEGNKSGTAGAAVLEITTQSGLTTFRSNIKGNRDHCAAILKDKASIIGKRATVKYFNLTPDGIPRFPYVVAIRDYE